MGQPAVGAADLAQQVVTGSIGALNAAGNSAQLLGLFNCAVWGTFVGTVALQCSFDGGTTWIPAFNKQTGAAITFTGPAAMQKDECEPGVLYRVQMTAYTSGTANYRLSEGAGSGDMRRLT